MYNLNLNTHIPFALISFRLARKTMVVDALQGCHHEFYKWQNCCATAALLLQAASCLFLVLVIVGTMVKP